MFIQLSYIIMKEHYYFIIMKDLSCVFVNLTSSPDVYSSLKDLFDITAVRVYFTSSAFKTHNLRIKSLSCLVFLSI